VWRLGLADVDPRRAAISGVFGAAIFVTSTVPDPRLAVQAISAGATLGSFALAVRTYRHRERGRHSRSITTAGDGPQTVIQMGDNRGRLVLNDGDPAEQTDDGGQEADTARK